MSDFYFPAFDEYNLDENEQSLCEYFMRLKCMESKAATEFEYVFETLAELVTIRQGISKEYAAMLNCAEEDVLAQLHAAADLKGTPKLTMQLIYTPGLAAAEIREQSALLRAESSAGSLILMMDDAIQRLRHSVWDAKRKSPLPAAFPLGPLVGVPGTAATLIYAAGNAYRHAKDWDGLIGDAGKIDGSHVEARTSKRTLDILEPTIGLDAIPGGMTCIAALTALALVPEAAPSFDALWDGRLTDIGRDFAHSHCKRSDAFDRVSEALSYQDNLTMMKVSHSNDESLWAGDDARE